MCLYGRGNEQYSDKTLLASRLFVPNTLLRERFRRRAGPRLSVNWHMEWKAVTTLTVHQLTGMPSLGDLFEVV
jgi:hypothetical protein